MFNLRQISEGGIVQIGENCDMSPVKVQVEKCNKTEAYVPKTDASPVDTNFLAKLASNVITFSYKNTEATDKNLVFGTPASLGATYNALLGNIVPDLGNGLPGVQDDFGASTVKTIGANLMVLNQGGIIVTKIEVFAPDTPLGSSQKAQGVRLLTVTLDAVATLARQAFIPLNTENNFSAINKVMPVDVLHGFVYKALAGSEFQMSIHYSAIAVSSYTQVGQ